LGILLLQVLWRSDALTVSEFDITGLNLVKFLFHAVIDELAYIFDSHVREEYESLWFDHYLIVYETIFEIFLLSDIEFNIVYRLLTLHDGVSIHIFADYNLRAFNNLIFFFFIWIILIIKIRLFQNVFHGLLKIKLFFLGQFNLAFQFINFVFFKLCLVFGVGTWFQLSFPGLLSLY